MARGRALNSNALRYTASGDVPVCVRQRADTLALQVWDTGIGIAPDKHAEVFEEFLQLGNPQRDQRKGLGMGLAIAAGLARSLQAHITLASKPGRGLVFSLVLPLHRGPWQAVTQPAHQPQNTEAALAITTPPRSLQGSTVLVVDDEETVRAGPGRAARLGLHRAAGRGVGRRAATGRRAAP